MRARSRASALLAALAIAATAVTGCGSDDGDDGGGASADTTAETTASGGATAMTATVGMEGVSFVPDTIKVAAGGTVKFDNTSTITHNVTFEDEKSGTLEVGDDYERKFSESGTFNYLCTFHAGMKGIVTVE